MFETCFVIIIIIIIFSIALGYTNNFLNIMSIINKWYTMSNAVRRFYKKKLFIQNTNNKLYANTTFVIYKHCVIIILFFISLLQTYGEI